MVNEIIRLIKEEEGASLIEYVLVIAAGAVIAGLLFPRFQNFVDSSASNTNAKMTSFFNQT